MNVLSETELKLWRKITSRIETIWRKLQGLKSSLKMQKMQMQIGVADIVQLFKESDLRQAEQKEKKKDGMEKELADAEELRLQSLETSGETRKRKGEQDGTIKGGIRRKSVDTFDYLREKNTQELEFRKQELAFKTVYYNFQLH